MNELDKTVGSLEDYLQGDSSKELFISQKDSKALLEAMKIILGSTTISEKAKADILDNGWKLAYRSKPPTIEEFLTEKWLGPLIDKTLPGDGIFPHVRKGLGEFWHPTSGKRNLILGSSIGTGKSFESTLSTLFVFVHLWLMKNPKQFFGLSQATSIVHALISFSLEKAGQLLLQPFMQMLQTSPKFHRVKMEERLHKIQMDMPDTVCWTTAGRMGSIQFHGDLHIALASSPQKLLGLNMIGATISEISFFRDQGFSSEYIWRIFQDAKARVRSRFQGKWLSGIILDSSPNDMEESPIDRYIFSGECYNDPENYVQTGTQWDLMPFKYPEWEKDKITFPVFRGNSKEPPRMLENQEDVEKYDKIEVYNVPVSLKVFFEENCIKNVKDYCGWPAGSQDKLISDGQTIQAMFNAPLKNMYTYIYAPADVPPEKLIWNTIRDDFFVHHGNGRYEFYRAPNVKRYIHIDQSESNDKTGISCVHAEITPSGEFVFVTDFTICIYPGKKRINLLAIPLFIYDLREYGGLNIEIVSFDQYQSAPARQFLEEKGFNIQRLSVDNMEPYLIYTSLINSKRLKCGRNIILKNNLRSLQEIKTEGGKRKIDHLKGKVVDDDGGSWTSSSMGLNAKDLSDSHCGAVYLCINNFGNRASYQWIEPELVLETENHELREPEDILNSPIFSRTMIEAKLKKTLGYETVAFKL